LQDWEIEEFFNEDVGDLPTCEQYYVDVKGDDAPSANTKTIVPIEYDEDNGFSMFLQLP